MPASQAFDWTKRSKEKKELAASQSLSLFFSFDLLAKKKVCLLRDKPIINLRQESWLIQP